MTEPTQDDFKISIFVPEGDTAVQMPRDPSVEHHSMRDWVPSLGRVAKVGAEQVQEQWIRTVDTLMKSSSTVAARSKEWSIEEIEVGLTLSAKGELLFVAEAGAEASIKFKLTRKSEPTAEAPALGSRVPSGS